MYTNSMIGSLVPIIRCDYTSGTMIPETPADVHPTNLSNLWPVIDFAFSPVYEATSPYGTLYFDLGTVQTFNSIFIAHPNSTLSWGSDTIIKVASAATDPYTNTGDISCIAGHKASSQYGSYSNAGRTMFYFYEGAVTARYIALKFPNSSYPENLRIEEVAFANLIEMQYNEELPTFSRTPGTINSRDLTMQNGRQVKIVTSRSVDSISASYKWSDDGSLARELYDIFYAIASNGTPLLWLPPVKSLDEEYLRYRVPEFINLDQIPEVTQQSASSWQMSLSGRCQP